MTRQVVLNIQTTGLEAEHGDRIIAIGAVEMVNNKSTGKDFYTLVNPEGVKISSDASKIHGLTDEDLADAPKFKEIAKDLLKFIKPASRSKTDLIIHNHHFTTKFIDYEMYDIDLTWDTIFNHCNSVIDTLETARRLHPNRNGNSNKLNDLCERYHVKVPEECNALTRAYTLMYVYQKMLKAEQQNKVSLSKNRKQTLFGATNDSSELNKRQSGHNHYNNNLSGTTVPTRRRA